MGNWPSVVITAYKTKTNNSRDEAEKLIFAHQRLLSDLDYLSDSGKYILQCKQGYYLEVFEWKSKQDFNKAHNNRLVVKHWNLMKQSMDFICLSEMPSAAKMFEHYYCLNDNTT